MRLRSLEIHGFKSFADRTRLQFDRQITGIVGPNGCGKSNVVDAIRWVLGEQKIRNLRSEKMENVIFNGTDQRKRANLTEVSITFDNDRGLLPAEFGSVAITRRLYRDGDSEYLLNGVPCRLKDIQNLLLDTGIGSDTYAIIELGQIEEMITDRQGSRRQLFEEAAGVSRYKIRKRETLIRLNDTGQSLERVEDLVFEVERQAKRYEKQAQKARKYRQLKDEYRAAGVRLAWLQLREASSSREAFEAEALALRERRAALETEMAKLESAVADLQPRRLEYENQLAIEQKLLTERIEAIRNLENERKLRQQKVEFMRQRLAQLQEATRTDENERTRCNELLDKLEARIDSENEAYDRLEYLLAEREQEVADLKAAVQNRKLQLDELSQNLKSKEQQLGRIRKEIDLRSVRHAALSEDADRLADDLAQQNQSLEKLIFEHEQIKKSLTHTEFQREEARRLRQQLKEEIAVCEQETLRLNEERSELLRRSALAQQEHDLIRNLIDNLEGYPESVAWLKRNVDEFASTPLVSDLFYCDETWRPALEHFIEGVINAYVVPDRATALRGIAALDAANQGRVHFICLDALTTSQPAVEQASDSSVRRLIDLVQVEAGYEALAAWLLGDSKLIDIDRFESKKITELNSGWVSSSGKIASRPGGLSGGSVGSFEGKRLGRRQLLQRLAEEIARHNEALTAIEKATEINKEKIAGLRQQLPDALLARLDQQVAEASREDSRLAARLQEFKKNRSRIETRQAEILPQIEQLQQEINELQPQADRLLDEFNELTQQQRKLSQQFNERNEAYSRSNQALNKEQMELLQAQNRISSIKQEYRGIMAKLEEINERANRYASEQKEIESNILSITQAETNEDEELLKRYREKDAQEQRVQTVREGLLAGRDHEQKLENQIKELRRQRESILNRMENLRNEQQQIELDLRSLTERLSAEWQIEIKDVRPEDWFEQIPAEGSDLQPWKTALEQLRSKFISFGEVNLTAEEAYDEASERLKFLVEQRQDLIEAQKNLLATIEEIDSAARSQFMQAFEKIRENFIRVFRTLFTAEDSCDLQLQNPADPLESAIEIMARPKGKRPLTLQQLSGGEKTLTAISLLFAIYLYKPAPFCIFDEVDAPLDDANIDKFSEVIERFSTESQFVVITHNKRTMQRTQTLYGITMEETGVSRVLAVDWALLNVS